MTLARVSSRERAQLRASSGCHSSKALRSLAFVPAVSQDLEFLPKECSMTTTTTTTRELGAYGRPVNIAP